MPHSRRRPKRFLRPSRRRVRCTSPLEPTIRTHSPEFWGVKRKLFRRRIRFADQAERERFVRKYQEMHRFARAPDGAEILHIGAENWPFPFPLVSENGKWHFDADAGMQEVMLRRIGEDELAVIETCRTLATGRQ